MNTPEIIKIITEAQVAFRQLSHLPDAAELCKQQAEQLEAALKELKP